MRTGTAAWWECNVFIADWISAAVAVVALAAVVFEYFRQRRRSRVETALALVARMNDDAMAQFAITVLDWGTGILVVPQDWRDVIRSAAKSDKDVNRAPAGQRVAADGSFVQWSIDDIKASTRGPLGDAANDYVRLLYRHAFVALFNHLEHMGALLNDGVIKGKDLRSISWLVREIRNWSILKHYPQHKVEGGFFDDALKSWYTNNLPNCAIDAILRVKHKPYLQSRSRSCMDQ